jgi:dipeptidyl-peptidase-4
MRIATLLLIAAAPLAAQTPDSLTLDRLFASGEFQARGAGQVRWLDGTAYSALVPSAEVEDGSDIVRVDPRTNGRTVLVPARQLVPAGAAGPLRVQGYSWSADGQQVLIFTNTQRVWRSNTRGDYWVLDRASGRLQQVGADRPAASLMYAKFSPDGTRVGFVSENDLYVQGLADGRVTRLTNDGSRTILNGRFDWVYEEEFTLGSPDGADGWRWSPDGSRIAYWQLDASGVRDFLLLNNTDSLYSFTIPIQYPKAGTTNSAARIGVVPAAGGETVWLRIEGDPRENYLPRLTWAGAAEVMVQHLNRLQNTLQVLMGDARTGAVRTILTERDSAWLDAVDDLVWLDDGRRFTWVSDRDGWRRLYLVDREGGTPRAVTPPETDVIAVVRIDSRGGWVYYYASPTEPTRRYLYRSRLAGAPRTERLTPAGQPGWHAYNVSPDGGLAFHTRSTFDAPPVVRVVELPRHRDVRVVEDNADLRAKVGALRPRPTEFFRVRTSDGVVMDGWMMKPRDFDPTRRWPVLFHVYGEPWGATATDSWGGTQTLWHQYLADHGYLVISLDNRGTPAPRGRAWRKVIYQQMGVINSRDQAMGVVAVADSFPFVDSARVAIWGWSGGGSSTLNAMFRYPALYHTGMAVAPVPDLRYYDTIYQERYTGHPSLSPEAYERGSPITYAHQLEGNLLVVHGTGDDNVHYQGTEALINKLIEHGKPFTMMAYPNRSHGIYEGPGTTRHVFGLLTRYLFEHLPAGPR